MNICTIMMMMTVDNNSFEVVKFSCAKALGMGIIRWPRLYYRRIRFFLSLYFFTANLSWNLFRVRVPFRHNTIRCWVKIRSLSHFAYSFFFLCIKAKTNFTIKHWTISNNCQYWFWIETYSMKPNIWHAAMCRVKWRSITVVYILICRFYSGCLCENVLVGENTSKRST